MTEEQRGRLAAAAVFAGNVVVAGRRLRPLTAGSYAALQMVRNPLVCGGREVGNPEEDGEALAAFLEFVWAHEAPVEEVMRLAADPQAFRQAALVHGARITFAELAELSGHFEAANGQVEAAAAEPAEVGKS